MELKLKVLGADVAAEKDTKGYVEYFYIPVVKIKGSYYVSPENKKLGEFYGTEEINVDVDLLQPIGTEEEVEMLLF